MAHGAILEKPMSAAPNQSRLQKRLRKAVHVPPERLKALDVSEEAWKDTLRIAFDRPVDCAFKVLTGFQKFAALFLLLILGLWLYAKPMATFLVINCILMTFYLIVVGYKLILLHVSLGESRGLEISDEEVAAIDDEELPGYTILVPLFHETETLPRLVDGLSRIDYPKDKLQVLLLLEETDTATREAVEAMDLPPFITGLVTPEGHPQTKPKACNLGLAYATGDYLVIYDAEDRPDTDQLKKAIIGFRKSSPLVICLQARLNFYNKRQNLLTRLFTLEYSMWFDLFLPGLSDMNVPIPLGGTSNHFRVDKLRELMGWDPFNVTEDCDLGIRIARNFYDTRMIDSTTWEEACSHPLHWIRQRSRWVKGYIQTYLVALRRPLDILHRTGWKGSLAFHVMVGGTFLSLLINPLYWALTLLWFVLRWEGVSHLFPFPVILWALICLFAGNFVFIYATLLAAYRRRYFDLVKYGLLVPFYWMLMSIGAWKGAIQLITRPSYWEKTQHGLDLEAGYDQEAVGDSEEPAP
jgi:cellulose synthase/poly-beta-1,6-N-acetylglucosamine synthase-like glycosyltransferase